MRHRGISLAAVAVCGAAWLGACTGDAGGGGGGRDLGGLEDAGPDLAGSGDLAPGDVGPADLGAEATDLAPDVGLPGMAPPVAALELERYDPRLYRSDDRSLAGEWLFAFDPEADGVERGMTGPAGEGGYDRRIVVPFPWQSVLSGVGPPPPERYAPFGSEAALHSYAGVAWYARWVDLPVEWAPDDEVALRFGAVDWAATVWVDGVEVGRHEGGFTPFVVSLGPRVGRGESVFVVLRVDDPCSDDPSLLLGKQGGFWYTCAGGIWQDVVLEHHPPGAITAVVDEPATDAGDLPMRVALRGPAGQRGLLRVAAQCIEAQCGAPCGPFYAEAPVELGAAAAVVELSLALPGVPLWHPDRPCLLARALEFAVGDRVDRVEGYTALRRVAVDWVAGHGPADPASVQQQYQGFRVADEPVGVRGVLDQGYHPEGILAPPSRAARRAELEQVRAWGFNAVRMHIKPEEPGYYAACDALGLLVIYDLPSARDFAPSGPDSPWRPAFAALLEDLVARDRSHPSILWWVVFNEAWGLLSPPFWRNEEGLAYVRATTERVRQLDPGRPVEDHSPGGLSEVMYAGALPHVATDVTSYHLYARRPAAFRERLSEFAAGTFPGSSDNLWGGGVQAGEPLVLSEFGGLGAGATGGDAFYPLHAQLNALWSTPKVVGWVVTQLTDVEWERNGLLRYDRQGKEAGLAELQMTLTDLFSEPYLVLGPEPARRVAPGAEVSLAPVLGSVAPVAAQRLVLRLATRAGESLWEQERALEPTPGGAAGLEPLAFVAPAEDGVYLLLARVEGPGGAPLARNGLHLVVSADGPPVAGSLEVLAPTFLPQGEVLPAAAARCEADCSVVYELTSPAPGPHRLTLVAELASFDPEARQTDADLLESTLRVLVDDEVAGEVILPDAPHDHRGVLSHLQEPEELAGAWGEPVELDLGVRELGQTVKLELQAAGNGVQVFYRQAGRFVVEPALRMERVGE